MLYSQLEIIKSVNIKSNQDQWTFNYRSVSLNYLWQILLHQVFNLNFYIKSSFKSTVPCRQWLLVWNISWQISMEVRQTLASLQLESLCQNQFPVIFFFFQRADFRLNNILHLMWQINMGMRQTTEFQLILTRVCGIQLNFYVKSVQKQGLVCSSSCQYRSKWWIYEAVAEGPYLTAWAWSTACHSHHVLALAIWTWTQNSAGPAHKTQGHVDYNCNNWMPVCCLSQCDNEPVKYIMKLFVLVLIQFLSLIHIWRCRRWP